MKNKTKVEIIQPFNDGQEKGDIRYMKPDDAKRYHEYGAVKIIEETKKPTQKKETKQKETIKLDETIKYETENEYENDSKSILKNFDLLNEKFKNLCSKLGIVKNFDYFNSDEITRKLQIHKLSQLKKEIENLKESLISCSNNFLTIKKKIINSPLDDKKLKKEFCDGEIKKISSKIVETEEEIFDINFSFFLLKNDIEIYKIGSKANVHFIVKEKEKTTKPLTIQHLHIDLELLYKKYMGDTFPRKVDNPKALITYIIDLRFLGSIFDFGYKPTQELFFEEDKKTFLNEYEPSDIEIKYSNTQFIKKDINELICESKKNFRTIHKLFMHLTGSEKIFYEDNLRLINLIEKKKEKNIYKTMFEQKLTYFKKEFSTDDINELKKIFLSKLDDISTDREKELNEGLMWLYKWIAFQIQNPTEKVPTGCAFRTEKGIGKDFIKDYVISFLIGKQNLTSISQEILDEKFNGYAYGKRFIFCNELSVESTSIAMFQKVKERMTNPTISIRKMHNDAMTIKNYAGYWFYSNKKNMLLIEENDRRFTVYEQKLKIPDLVTYEINNSYLNMDNIPQNWQDELENFYIFLKTIDVNYHEIKESLNTSIKEEMTNSTKSDIKQFIEYCSESFNEPLQMIIFFSNTSNYCQNHLKSVSYANDEKKSHKDFKNSIFNESISIDLLFECFNTFKRLSNIKGNRTQNSFSREISDIYNIKSKPAFNPITKKTSRFFSLKAIFSSFSYQQYTDTNYKVVNYEEEVLKNE